MERLICDVTSVWKNNKKQILKCILFTFVFGFIAHGYMFSNNSISHDSLAEFSFTDSTIVTKLEAGRFFAPIYKMLVGNVVTSPWIIGVLSLLYTGIALFLITKIFNISSNAVTVLTAGVLTCNLTVISLTATYIHDLDSDILAMLLAVIAVYLFKRFDKGFLFAPIPIALSLGLYQSYISVAITLVLMMLIFDLLDGAKCKEVVIKGLKAVAMLLIAVAVYWGLVVLSTALSGIAPSTSIANSISTPLSMSIPDVLKACIWVYFVTCGKIVFPISIFNYGIIVITAIIILLAGIVIIKKILDKNISVPSKILTLVLILLLPLAMNSCRVLTNNRSSDLMHYSLWFVYVFVLLVFSKLQPAKASEKHSHARCETLSKGISFALVAVIICSNVSLANTAYNLKDFQYDATLSLMTRVTANIENFEGYVPNETPVAIIGEPNSLIQIPDSYDKVRDIMGFQYLTPISYYGIRGFEAAYYKYILMNNSISLAGNQVYADLAQNEYVKQMPIYPSAGSMQYVEEVLVVKLGEV